MAASNESIIYGFLTGTEHFTAAGAAAALGNFQVESGFNPTSYNSGEGAVGIAQWELGRRTKLQAYAAAHGGSETDLTMQLGYLGQELAGPFKAVADRMRAATSSTTAAADWDQNFEGSAGTTRTQRVDDAQSIYGQISSGTLTGASSYGGNGQPPIDPSKLAAKLTAPQRVKIVAYLNTNANGSGSKVAKQGDAALITAYKDYLTFNRVKASTIASGINSAVSDLNPFGGVEGWVSALVVKGGASLAGLALIVIGLAAAAKPIAEQVAPIAAEAAA